MIILLSITIEPDRNSESEWKDNFTFTLSTVLPAIAIGVACYVLITRVLKHRIRSKRQVHDTDQEAPTPIHEGKLKTY